VRDRKGALLRHPPPLPPTALYDVQIKRIHEYKRQLLNALHLVMLYHEWKEGKERLPRMAIFGGKAAPGYVRAKEVILLLSAIGRKLTREEHCGGRLGAVFIENYNVSKAEVIIPAADLSEQISAAGWEASGTGNMKLTMNGALTIGTEDGANIEMRESIGDKWWPFRFGATAAENRVEFRAQEVYHRDEAIRRAVDTLRDGTFAETAEERASFAELYRSLVESDRGHSPDRYRVLKDLRPYYDTQKRVEELYQDRLRWSECALHNIAGMGPFSTDRTAEAYAREIWGIAPTPPDPEIVKQVREEYAAHDRCRIQSSPAPQ
jgi:starch phosphorylase